MSYKYILPVMVNIPCVAADAEYGVTSKFDNSGRRRCIGQLPDV